MMTKLSGKTALVTGASRGIGRATALALAGAGAQVLVRYSSAAQEAAVVEQIVGAGGKAEMIAADLRAPDGPHTLARACRLLLAAVWTFWLPTPESRRPPRSSRCSAIISSRLRKLSE